MRMGEGRGEKGEVKRGAPFISLLPSPISLSHRGGILLDMFLIAAILAGGVAAWTAWRRGSIAAMWKDVSALAPAGLPSPRPAEPREPDIDVSDRSAWLQSLVREELSRRGVKEKHILRAYNAERQEGGIQWLEGTLEVRRPVGFSDAAFLSALAGPLSEKRLSLMEDRREGFRRVLELGDRKRVYQRIVFESPR